MSNQISTQGPSHEKDIEIIVNLNKYKVTGKEITYRDVAKLAFPNDTLASDITYTITYSSEQGPDGELHEGKSVKLHEGMVFVVAKSSRS